MDRNARIVVVGAGTLIGAALRRRLDRQGYAGVTSPDDKDMWSDANPVDALFAEARPSHVFVAGGMSGGIGANERYPADLMRDNLLTACHVIGSAHRHGVKKLLYLASSCTYPRDAAQPMRVDALMTGPLEATSRAYALAKLAGIELCRAYRRQYGAAFIAAIPADVFGPGDDLGGEDSHVVSALMRKIHDAKAAGSDHVEVWGTGSPRRELMFADDAADAAIAVMERYEEPGPINLGGGTEISIRALAELIREVVGYRGVLRFDASKPDGMPAKALEWSALRAMGWRPATRLRDALARTYAWFVAETSRVAAPSP